MTPPRMLRRRYPGRTPFWPGYAAMQAAPYVQYGVPKLLAYAAGFGLLVPGDEALARMGRRQSVPARRPSGGD